MGSESKIYVVISEFLVLAVGCCRLCRGGQNRNREEEKGLGEGRLPERGGFQLKSAR